MSYDRSFAQEKKLSKVLNLFIWEAYLAPDTLENFEKRFGVKTNLVTYTTEDEMLSGIQAYPDKYDLIITAGDSIREMRGMRLLAQINTDNIPNIKNIDPKFRHPRFDPEERYCVPYMWGTTGFVVNRKFIKEKADSWAVLWNPDYKGKLAMMDSMGEVMSATFKYLGYSANSIDAIVLEKAGEKLLAQKPLLVGYLDYTVIRDKLISEELWAAHSYNGEGLQAADENENLEYIIPKEGSVMWLDCWAVPRDAKNKYTAEVFINYINEPKVMADIANYLFYASCNSAAAAFTNKEILESPALYPPEETLKKCEFFGMEGDEETLHASQQIRNKIWVELQK